MIDRGKKHKAEEKKKKINRRMALTTDYVMTPVHKGLSEWWSEETEYVFQRIERWAAFARGYNRLRSERLSKGRLTMNEEQESRWSISSNKLVIDDLSWNPAFHTLKRSRRRSRQEEEIKINRYTDSVLGYRSNANLDSTCLETYRYDHSIYFKTIGEIRNGKKDRRINDGDPTDRRPIDSEEEREVNEINEVDEVDEEEQEEEEDVELEENEATFVYNSADDRFYLERNNSSSSSNGNLESKQNTIGVWPIVDLAKLDLNRKIPDTVDHRNNEIDWNTVEANNNYVDILESIKIDTKNEHRGGGSGSGDSDSSCKDQDAGKGILAFKMIKHRPSRTVKRSTVCGDNNVLWPGILLNYTRNVDPTSPASPHHHRYSAHIN